MGLFLAVSGIIGSSRFEVQDALKAFAEGQSGGFEIAEGTTDDPNIGVISRDTPNTSVLYPNGFMDWDDASQYLSKQLSKPVFSFHIHDGDLWMYRLFDKGEEIGHFNPLPEYWGELPPNEKERWQGDAELISNLVPNVSPDSVSGYLVEWDPTQEERVKAYPDDEFALSDCWQMCDFMRKVGLKYPMSGDESVLADTFRLWTKDYPLELPEQQSEEKDVKRKWRRFWQE